MTCTISTASYQINTGTRFVANKWRNISLCIKRYAQATLQVRLSRRAMYNPGSWFILLLYYETVVSGRAILNNDLDPHYAYAGNGIEGKKCRAETTQKNVIKINVKANKCSGVWISALTHNF